MHFWEFLFLPACNREHISEMWKPESSSLFRAAMSRVKTVLNSNLAKNYKPKECIPVDEQLFPYRGHTKFTQHIPSKPAKYGMKIFWACDAANAYPLQGQLYARKPPDGERQVNEGERTVLDLVAR